MELRDVITALAKAHLIAGAVKERQQGFLNAPIEELVAILEKELDRCLEELTAVKAEPPQDWPEPAKAKDSVLDCPSREPDEPVRAGTPITVGGTAIVERPPIKDREYIDPERIRGDVVNSRPECKKCGYRLPANGSKTTFYCGYLAATGKSRNCFADECEHWKDAVAQKKPERRKANRHVCSLCGEPFTDGAARTKICPACREKTRRGE